ncbi:MAG: hypothetical protein ABJB01_03045 [Rudaea sp.]
MSQFSSRITALAMAVSVAYATHARAGIDTSPYDFPSRRSLAAANCADNGTGTLRQLLKDAEDGDVIHTACSTISLTTGAMVTTAPNVSIVGDATNPTKILGNYSDNILIHAKGSQGTVYDGVLLLNNVVVVQGYANDAFGGACLFSQGSVTLVNSRVSQCQLSSTRDEVGNIGGAAIFASNRVKLYGSSVTDSQSTATHEAAHGGAIRGRIVYLLPALDSQGRYIPGTGSTVSRSHAYSTYAPGLGGCVYATSAFFSLYSTVYGCKGTDVGGVSTGAAVVVGSTIADNAATNNLSGVGGLQATTGGGVYFFNSTVAFNSGSTTGGVRILSNAIRPKFYNNIFSNSSKYSGVAWNDLSSPATIVGSGNIIVDVTTFTQLPSDTIRSDPGLGLFANHGGSTLTFLPSAPFAFGKLKPKPPPGNGNLFKKLFSPPGFDQRGIPRPAGSSGDFGSVQDTIFNDSD